MNSKIFRNVLTIDGERYTISRQDDGNLNIQSRHVTEVVYPPLYRDLSLQVNWPKEVKDALFKFEATS